MARKGDSAKAEYWQEVIDQQQQSGLSIKAFCTGQNISPPSFYQWKSKLQTKQQPVATASNGNNCLLPVQLVASDDEKARFARNVQIITPSGYCIRLDSQLSVEQFSNLLSMIESTGLRGPSC
jgi:hypothetical protein